MKEWAANENALIEVSATEISDKYNGKTWWICPVCDYKYTMSVQARYLKEKRHQNACPRCNGRLQKRLHFL
ncbi:zinc-ribbon domain-containing protein [Sharpea azabuensis]